jgi:putative phosphoribosyl transferase
VGTPRHGRAGDSAVTADPAQAVEISADGARLAGDLAVPERALGVIAFAHGSGSSRLSPRNRQVAEGLQTARLGTLLFDLLTPEEEQVDAATGKLRFDVNLLSGRLMAAVRWLARTRSTESLLVGLFGASTGAAAALAVAAEASADVAAVVSRGGRPDLSGDEALSNVRAPTLLIVGELDDAVLDLNRAAASKMRAEHRIEVVSGASHLFEEPGALEQVTRLATDWFVQNIR